MHEPPGQLRVATLNVYSPQNPDWDRRSSLLSHTLPDLAADIIALQEVPVDDDFATVSALLGNNYAIHPFSTPSDDGVAGVLATRGSSVLIGELDQRSPERDGNLPWAATLLVEVDTQVGKVLAVHHKPSWQFPWELDRERQALTAATRIEELASDYDHVVVLGDFDATPDAASMEFWRGRRSLDGRSVCYQDAWETAHPQEAGHTFVSSNPLVSTGEVRTAVDRRIDYVLIRSGLHGSSLLVTRCERLYDAPVDGVWASDHFGVVADLADPSAESGSAEDRRFSMAAARTGT
jgi:endonuclease/exonuclease/phosphatase family metal-dependent hydrolase